MENVMRNTTLGAGLYLALIIAVFAIQTYIILLDFMPTVLVPFKEFPGLYSHVESALRKMMMWISFWALLLIGTVLGYLIGAKYRQGKRKSSELK